MHRLSLVAALAACSGTKDPADPPDDADADTDTDADSDADSDADTDIPTGDPAVVAASCVRQPDNTLRFDCTVTTNLPTPVQVRLLDGGTELGVFRSDAEDTAHTVVLWGMTPDSDYAFEASAPVTPDLVVGGDLHTGELPPSVAAVLTVDAPGAYGVRYVLFEYACGPAGAPEGMMIARDDGQVVWYQLPDGISADDDDFEGFSFTAEGTLLANLERNRLVEWDLAGHLLRNLSVADETLPHLVHHDVERLGDLTYVLTARGVEYPDGNLYAMDGFNVLDADNNVLGSWSTEGLFDPTLAGPSTSPFWDAQIGDGADWAHGNALALGPSGEVYVSLRFVNAIIKVAGDPADPAFGTVGWVLLGEETAEPYSSDFTLTSSTGNVTPVNFGEQHHVSVLPSGDLLMWDNRASGQATTRALQVHVDEATHTADLVDMWDSGIWCPGRGSAFFLPNGNMLVDCSPENTLLELDAQTDAVVWSMTATCPNGNTPLNQLYRAVPLDPYPH